MSKVRRKPEQTRSRERVDNVLQATRELISEQGSDEISMTTIAAQAEMPVTALYRYFPNKQAVLRELALQTLQSDREALSGQFIESDQPLDVTIRAISLQYYKLHQHEPFRLALRNTIQSDSELTKLDLADTRAWAKVVGKYMKDNGFAKSLKEAERTILMNITYLDATIRLCAQVSRAEAKQLLEHCLDMSVRQVMSLGKAK